MKLLALLLVASAAFSQVPAAAPTAKTQTPRVAPAAPAAKAVPVAKTTVTVHELMHAMTDPGSRGLWDVAVKAPATDKDWEALQNYAVLVVESANLMLMPGMMRSGAQWVKSSTLLSRTGAASLKAARAKNLDALTEAGDLMVESCDACHLKYMKQ